MHECTNQGGEGRMVGGGGEGGFGPLGPSLWWKGGGTQFPPKPKYAIRDTLCSCDAYGMRPTDKEKNRPMATTYGRSMCRARKEDNAVSVQEGVLRPWECTRISPPSPPRH